MNDRIELIDGHAHLNELDDIPGDFTRAQDMGVTAIIGVGMDLESNRRILSLAEEYPGFVFPAIGFHPWEIRKDEIDDTLSFLEDNIHQCVALGEVGLDYKARVKKNLQRDVFREIITLAVTYDKILILHCRYSHQRVFSMITDGGIRRAVFHWYTGPSSVLRDIIAADYYISITPAVTYHEEHRRAAKEAPLPLLLLETDSPVVYGRGRDYEFKAQPADVTKVLAALAEIKQTDAATLGDATTQSATQLFPYPNNG